MGNPRVYYKIKFQLRCEWELGVQFRGHAVAGFARNFAGALLRVLCACGRGCACCGRRFLFACKCGIYGQLVRGFNEHIQSHAVFNDALGLGIVQLHAFVALGLGKPSVLKELFNLVRIAFLHCGLRGFSTSKLGGYSAVPIPFNVGEWIGPDGNSIIAALKPEGYGTVIKEDRSSSPDWLKRIEQNGARSGVFADYTYFGTGDKGGAPPEESVKWIEKSMASAGAVRVICARADQMFNDITDAQKARLPKYQGDLLLREHSAGSITSQAYMKHWNH